MRVKGEVRGDNNFLNECLIHKRLSGPKTFKKALITSQLINKGYEKENELLDKGGLSKEQYGVFLNELNQRNRATEEVINDFPDYKLISRNPLFGVDKKRFKIEGKMKLLVLLVEFENRHHQTEKKYFENLLFSHGSNYSMRDYFDEVSCDKLNIEGQVTEWITLGEYEKYLVPRSNDEKTWIEPDNEKLVFDALKTGRENNLLPDFSYENFNTLIIVGAGPGFNRTLKYEDIAPHRGPLQKPIMLGNKLIDHYIMINEVPEYDLGGYCHEFAHELGLPDLYCDDGQSIVVGRWCLMGAGSYNNGGRTPSHLSAWCKWKLGWVKSLEINSSPELYKIPSVNSAKTVYKLNVPNSLGKEYYLIENRQQTGFDQNIPGNGLLIWHINENGFFKGLPNLNIHNLALTLKQADGKEDLEKEFDSHEFLDMIEDSLGGDGGDAFPGETNNRDLNPDSMPNSDSYNGYNTGIFISSISDSAEVMEAFIGYERPESISITHSVIPERRFIFNFDKLIPLFIKEGPESNQLNYQENTSKKTADYWKGYNKGHKDGYRFLRDISN